MQPFVYLRPENSRSAVEATRPDERGVPHWQASRQFIAGGTNMTDYMKLDVMRPEVVVDINRLAGSEYGRIEVSDRGLRLGALVRMAEAEDHGVLRSQYPVIYDTLQLAATRQIRNMATLGGNVLQQTRPGRATGAIQGPAARRWTGSTGSMRCSASATIVSPAIPATLPRL
jgi:xanthine dehydrogenase YagS FAD-binding subunit